MSRVMDQPADYSKNIYDSLPANAKQYYAERSDKSIVQICYKLSFLQKAWRNINLIRLYPLNNMMYLNSNEFLCVIVNGEHRIYQGPGFNWVVGITDSVVVKCQIGEDINFGPIKIAYVRAGCLKFCRDRNTGKPTFLGPGMHYFNDINLEFGRELSMNFQGDNKTLSCDDAGAFQFIFVKTGSEAIIISRDGQLSIIGPGLHFIQAPDALKTFISIQQQHLKFGSLDANQSFLTADNIELHINATIFYRIDDVRTMFTTRIQDERDLIETLHSQAMATLLTIIRSETFQGIGKKQHAIKVNKDIAATFETGLSKGLSSSTTSVTGGVQIAEPINASAPVKSIDALESITMGFQNIIHDAEPQFVRNMQINFSASGIEIQSLRIEQIEFADKTMQKQVSEFAMTNTKLTSQQQTISAQRALQVAEAERDSATLLIKSRAEADKNILMTDAQNSIKISTARAEAQNRLILAEADAQAKIKVGEAEVKIMELQNRMPNAQLRIVTEAQKELMKGITKVIYTDQQSMLLKPYMGFPDPTLADRV